MILQAKQQILIALYLEGQKDRPHMEKITPQILGITAEQFNSSITDLLDAEWIKDVKIIDEDAGIPLFIDLAQVKATHQGIAAVENILEINNWWEPAKKVEKIKRQAAAFRLTALENFAAKVLADILKGQ